MADITFITGVKFVKSVVNALNNVTFIYDPNWEGSYTGGVSDNNSLPISFFHVKKMQEVMTSDISTQKMMFFNSNSASNKETTTGGIINVVADNIVIKPKVYKLDIIIPYKSLLLQQNTYVFNNEQFSNALAFTVNKGDSVISVSDMSAYLHSTASITIKQILGMVFNTNFNLDSLVTSMSSIPDYNKNSMEAMWRSRKVLKMKTWNSWAYKYVAIQELTIDKEPTEDDVYEGTLTVSELPILTMNANRSGIKVNNNKWTNPLLASTGKAIIKTLDGLETVSSEAPNTIKQWFKSKSTT